MELVVIVVIIIAIGSIIANLLITALVFKLYTEYWKDITIKRRYENEQKSTQKEVTNEG